MEIDELTYDAIVNYIYDIEIKDNPYDVNKNIKIHKIQRDPFNYLVQYSVQYISQLDIFWKKWNTKNIKIDIDGENFTPYIRDSKIDTILKK